jgi:deoxyribose-phosphate aldolase
VVRTAEQNARIALACLDLTSLNDGDSEADILRLAERAAAAPGRVAALCVWPRFVRVARSHAPPGVAVAAVANFPEGGGDIERALRDTGEIVQAGAQEIDLVLPWRALMAGNDAVCAALLRAVRRASEGLRLKVILESGELATTALVAHASRLALSEGADFLKTSTGKTPRGATPEAARVMLQAIAADAHAAALAGFKASGGVRSVADAAVYIDLVESSLGAGALVPARFRIGASGLLADIEAVLAGRGNAPAAAGY